MKKLVFALALTVGMAACAGNVSRVYVTADTTAVTDLLKFKTEKDSRCDAGTIPASTCTAVSKAFVPVWDSYLTVNKLVTSEAPIKEVDAAVSDLQKAGVDLKDALAQVKGDARKILEDLLAAALQRWSR